MAWEVVMGLEVHVELNTKTKIFCSCTTEFGGAPNTHCCPICTGQPGTLPKLNRKVLESAVMTGIALNCDITRYNKFDRKNYFYPDLPKAYQISQLYLPFARDGRVDITTRSGKQTSIRIHEIHMEEDAGKLVHSPFGDVTYPDWNRCGVPLLEIVSEPDFRSAEEVIAYLEKLKSTLQYLGVSDCKMEEGSMRADVNLSVREVGAPEFGTRTEMKNINSFKSIERAIAFESQRQIDCLEFGEEIVQETRRWDENRGKTYSMRSKENAQDYRYFPEPDIPPVSISEEMIQALTAAQPEMADAKKARYRKEFGMSEKNAEILTGNKHFAKIFEDTIALGADVTETTNWLMGHTLFLMGEKGVEADDLAICPSVFAKFVELIVSGRLNRIMGKEVFEKVFEGDPDFDVEEYIKENNLEAISDDSQVGAVVKEVLDAHMDLVADYKAGDEKLYGFFIGQCMMKLKGKASPALVNKLVREEIERR
ncbi:MAG: Asp-tRNA(Asn)/Glu-tRNA(Gln) amidotransferase subunit GatB [Firmicutes bacterium]|nr:Asp-tRNA(Asn)/Glu-tRNA(Gln) amidotransferase subunit GatB [Bacillota bacterium]